jgi:hypothetical protein
MFCISINVHYLHNFMQAIVANTHLHWMMKDKRWQNVSMLLKESTHSWITWLDTYALIPCHTGLLLENRQLLGENNLNFFPYLTQPKYTHENPPSLL